jgi:hypothetical protein
MGAEVTNIAPGFEKLSDSLALGSLRERAAVPARRETRVRQAFLQYEAGHRALGRWDLMTAESAFAKASDLDPEFAQASLMLAQVMAWRGAGAAEWHVAARQAVSRQGQLDPRERSRAHALLALAEERFPQACEQYDAMIARDSLDFTAWYGRGECLSADPIVERDARSPSGWKFRGSWHSGILAFTRAMELLPSFHRAQRDASPLPTDLFPVEHNQYRRGYALTPDTIRFAAQPGFEGDSLSLVPYPVADVLDGRAGVTPESNAAAVAWARQHLRRVAEGWVRAFPNSAEAHYALGVSLETSGDVRGAWREVRGARGFAGDRLSRVAYAADEVRLMVKAGEFDRARQLAESTFSLVGRTTSADEAWFLAGVAALVGRVTLTAELLERRAEDTSRTFLIRGEPVVVPRALAEASLSMLAYASFPGTRDTVIALQRRVEGMIRTTIAPSRAAQVRQVTLSLPITFGYRYLDPESVLSVNAPTDLHGMQRAYARRDFALLRVIADSAGTSSSRPIDFLYHEALLLLAVGDTAAATRRLDSGLDGLPNASQILLTDVHRAAAIPATMHLRAQLAARAGATDIARRWSQGAVALWSGADPEVRALLQDVRPLLQGAR